jgi:Domain of unknown function (DUF397)
VVDVPMPPVAASWQKSSATGGQECVQVARTREYVWVRDSKEPRGPVLALNREQWVMFLAGVQRGGFDDPVALT